MGGALNYRDPERAEHNFRMDPAAVSVVLATARRLSLVISDTTFSPHMEITRGSELHRRLADPVGPAWARVVSAHLDQWFARFYPGTRQHDSLALAAALSVPVLTMYDATVALDPIARMSLDPAGVEVRLSGNADYPAFMTWLSQRLNEALTRSSALGTNRDTPSADQLEADWQLVGGQACGDGVR
jgi:pyrimidine-specific ribonucleoside hydrolase